MATNEEREAALGEFMRCQDCDMLALREAVATLLLDRQRVDRIETLAKKKGQVLFEFRLKAGHTLREAIDREI